MRRALVAMTALVTLGVAACAGGGETISSRKEVTTTTRPARPTTTRPRTTTTKRTTTTTTKPELTLEYKLAVIDTGRADPSAELQRSYGRALDLLERVCPEDRTMLSDMAVKAQEILRDKNVDESILEVLQNLRLAIPEDASRGDVGDCSQVLATYLVLRIGG